MESETSNRNELRELILNSNEPFIIKHQLNWELLSWTLQDWQELLKTDELRFRCGTKSFTPEPQWERSTTTKLATFEEFLSHSESTSDKWMYFDYKHLREWLNDIQALRDNINWANFGFPELSSEDSTIWIGSTGAHTPCHIDTYGCNLIAQVYGRKQWILFPPEEDLKPSRVPYEESSIYSRLNFYSPKTEDFKGVKRCRKIILEAGEVLCVPHKWWHYVENLDLAISINVWLPLATDDEDRLKESLVQFFISQIVMNLDQGDMRNTILNPNFDEDAQNMTMESSIKLVKKCKDIMKASHNKDKKAVIAQQEYLKKNPFLHRIGELSDEEFRMFITKQRNRFPREDETPEEDYSFANDLIDVINAFTHPDTVQLIQNKFLK